MREKNRGRAIGMLVAATAAWALSLPTGKALLAALALSLPGATPFALAAGLTAMRFGSAGMLLWLGRPSVWKDVTSLEWQQGLIVGSCGGLGMLLQFDALHYTAASTVAFLTQFTCVLIPLIIAVRTRRRPSLLTLLCVALVMPGVAVLARFDMGSMQLGRGELETLLGSIVLAIQVLALDPPIFRKNHPHHVTLVMFLTTAVLIAPLAITGLRTASWLPPSTGVGRFLAVFFVLVVISSLLAFWIMIAWQPTIDAATAGVIYTLEPLFATVLALILPGWLSPFLGVHYANETLTWHLLVGGSLITLANLFISLKPSR